MGRVASSVDNTLIESFWSTMQRELLHTRQWATRTEPAAAIFEWIEAWYNPRRRHTSLGDLAPAEYENLHTTAVTAARSANRNRPGNRVRLRVESTVVVDEGVTT